jgi:hypothetical protein
MAALTKSRPAQLDDNRIALSSSIPTPFSSADRDYILHSSHTNGLHHPITPSPIAHDHAPHAQESQVDGEVLLNADRVVRSLYATFVPSLIWVLQFRINISCHQ